MLQNDMSTNKEKFINALSRTGREGIDKVLRRLEDLGFYEAPASTKFHLSRKGGLLEHSLNVYEAALGLWEQAIRESILSRKKPDGYWEKYLGYTADYNAGLPLGHGEKSVIMLLSWGLELKPEEMMAIRWHMTAWDLPMQSPEHKESLNAAKAKTPLVSLIQLADGMATGLMER